MSEKRFTFYYERGNEVVIENNGKRLSNKQLVDLLNEQQELIEELQVSDEMGWKRAEHFEKKCPKELHNKKMYIKRLEYKVQKFKEMNSEQQATINRLEEENDNMNLFIKQTIEPLLFDCVFELSTIESMSQVELAKKIENEIIPFIQDFKYLKYESLEEAKQDKSE